MFFAGSLPRRFGCITINTARGDKKMKSKYCKRQLQKSRNLNLQWKHLQEKYENFSKDSLQNVFFNGGAVGYSMCKSSEHERICATYRDNKNNSVLKLLLLSSMLQFLWQLFPRWVILLQCFIEMFELFIDLACFFFFYFSIFI